MKEMGWYDTFVKKFPCTTAYDILAKLDEIMQIYSFNKGTYTMEQLLENEDDFGKVLLAFMLKVAQDNLEHDTTVSGREGTFDKRSGEPGLSHIVWEVRGG